MVKIKSIYQQNWRHKKGINKQYNTVYLEGLKDEIIDMRKNGRTIAQIREYLINTYGNQRGFSMSNIGKISKQAGISVYNGGETSPGSGRKKDGYGKRASNFGKINLKSDYKFNFNF